jgi:hypothetical protein
MNKTQDPKKKNLLETYLNTINPSPNSSKSFISLTRQMVKEIYSLQEVLGREKKSSLIREPTNTDLKSKMNK